MALVSVNALRLSGLCHADVDDGTDVLSTWYPGDHKPTQLSKIIPELQLILCKYSFRMQQPQGAHFNAFHVALIHD